MTASSPYSPIEKMSSVTAVEQRLRNEILTGRLKPGAILPPERELAIRFGVNRLTLRAALAKLAAAGLLVSEQGSGNRVLDFRRHAGLESLPDLAGAFAEDAVMIEKLVTDLLSLRRCLTAEACAMAAGKSTPHDLGLLRGLAAAQRARVADLAAFRTGDVEFSRALIALADNTAFELAFNTIIEFARKNNELFERLYVSPYMHCNGYDALIALIATGDGNLARDTVREGLEALDQEFMRQVRRFLRNHPAAGEPT